jgi:multiple sugar transport system permease protein
MAVGQLGAPAITIGGRRQRRTRWERRRSLTGFLFVLPALVLVAIFFLVPLVFAIWMSLTKWNIAGFQSFVGLDNYANILSDTRFLDSVVFTTLYTAVVTVITFLLGFALALLVRSENRRFVMLRTMFYLPVVIGVAVGAFIFLWLFNETIGPVNGLLRSLGITSANISWLSTPSTAFITLIVMVVWKSAGFAMITLLIGMQAVPQELYEASRVDGASNRQQLWHITVPLIRPTIALVIILLVTGSYLAFDQFYIITRGGPNNSTITAVYWIYNQAFIAFRLGYATAMSVVLMLFLVLLSAIQLRLLRRDSTQD